MKALRMHGQQRTAYENTLLYESPIKDADRYMWAVDWRDFSLPYCSLYVVTPDNDWPCKIGISVSPRKRLTTLQTSVWRPLRAANCFWCPTVQDARALEKKVHTMLTDDNKWLHGEWFDMRPKDATDMIMFAASVIGVECNDTITDKEVADAIQEQVWTDGFSVSMVIKRASAQDIRLGKA